jgi:PPOX class probable F420-dependent enzyme
MPTPTLERSTAPADAPLAPLGTWGYIMLTTFRRDGTPVACPVWWAPSSDARRLYVVTALASGKVKRIRHNAHVALAPCTHSGEVRGPTLDATARMLPTAESQPAADAIVRRYGWLAHMFRFFWWVGRRPAVFIEIRF